MSGGWACWLRWWRRRGSALSHLWQQYAGLKWGVGAAEMGDHPIGNISSSHGLGGNSFSFWAFFQGSMDPRGMGNGALLVGWSSWGFVMEGIYLWMIRGGKRMGKFEDVCGRLDRGERSCRCFCDWKGMGIEGLLRRGLRRKSRRLRRTRDRFVMAPRGRHGEDRLRSCKKLNGCT